MNDDANKKLADALIGFTGEILLPPFSDYDKYVTEHRFISGNRNDYSGFGMTWRITQKGHSLLNTVVSILREQTDIFLSKRSAMGKHIMDFFQKNCCNAKLFNGDAVFFLRNIGRKTLLDCISVEDKRTFGQLLAGYIAAYLKEKEEKFLILYPITRIKIENDVYQNNNFSVFKSTNIEYWNSLKENYPALNMLISRDCTLIHKHPVSDRDKPAWMSYCFYGDIDNCRDFICRKIREFLSILIAVASKSNKNALSLSITPSYNLLLAASKDRCVEFYENNLLHSFGSFIELSSYEIEKIFDLQNAIGNMTNDERKNRFSLFAEYYMRSLNDRSEAKVINQFIAVDALWGMTGKSKESTTNGMLSVIDNNTQSKNCVNSLYSLRCELLHGGCATIDEWKNYDKYIRDFNEEPEKTLDRICVRAIEVYASAMDENKVIGETE